MHMEILARGIFYWLRAPRDYANVRHNEWILSIARILLSACCCGAIIWVKKPALDWKLPFAYLVYSLLILLALRLYRYWHPAFHIAVHLADIFWVAHLILLIGQPNMVLALWLFVMASAAARWGFWEALLTAFSLGFFILLNDFLHNAGIPIGFSLENIFAFLPDILLYLAMSLTIALFAQSRAVRMESQTMAQVQQDIRLETGFEKALEKFFYAGFQHFGATQILVASHDRRNGLSSLFQAASSQAAIESAEIPPSRYEQYFFPAPGTCWRLACTRESGRPRFRFHWIDAGKVSRDKTGFRVPDAFLAAHPVSLLLAASPHIGDELSIRIFLINVSPYFGGLAGLRFMERAVRLAAPVVYDLFLVDGLRAKAEADAGKRMARELHDGVIQSLADINLQLEDLRRQVSSAFPPGADRLARIQEKIQEEIASLRGFMQQLRFAEVDGSHLIEFLSGMALKFQCDFGITTRFIPEVDEIRLQPRVCAELARIVQEALVNIRKHSEASEVFIRLGRRNGSLVLGIIDNGRGYGFSGHYSNEELRTSGKGPAVIMERAREINAEISIESVEGHGSCLEIILPQIEGADVSTAASVSGQGSQNKS